MSSLRWNAATFAAKINRSTTLSPKTHDAISRRGIEIVQAALNNASYKIESDGYMTKGTRGARKTYQADHKLKVTGIVNPATLKNLNIKNFEKWL